MEFRRGLFVIFQQAMVIHSMSEESGGKLFTFQKLKKALHTEKQKI